MKKIKMKDIILNHYQKVHELELHGVTVRVWKPRTMQKLPAHNMLHVIDDYAWEAAKAFHTCDKAYWDYGNPDWRMWDALLVRYIDPRRKTLDIYFTAILVRPFSREAYEWYNSCHTGLEQIERLMLMWDSREFDRIGGFDQGYGRPSDMDTWKYSLYHVVMEKYDIEDLSPNFYHGDDDAGVECRCVKIGIKDDQIVYSAAIEKDKLMKDGGTPLILDCAKAFYDFRKKHPDVTEIHFYTDEVLSIEDDDEEEGK